MDKSQSSRKSQEIMAKDLNFISNNNNLLCD